MPPEQPPETADQTYEFTFHQQISREQLPVLNRFNAAFAHTVICASGTEAQALEAAKEFYGDRQTAHAIRMALDYDQLPPEVLCDEGLPELAELHSRTTGERWQPRPAAEIPLHVFVELLELANEIYWENYERTLHLTPEALRGRGIAIEMALQRTDDVREQGEKA